MKSNYWKFATNIIYYVFSPGAMAVKGSYFGDGEGPYVLSDTSCGSHHNSFTSCALQGYVLGYNYSSECSPGHDAGVICQGMWPRIA